MIPVIDNILGHFSQDLGVDLGTANTLIYVRDKGIVVREPSIVCLHKKTKKVLAIGQDAKKMVGRTPASIEMVKPLRDGVISDFDITLAMLSHFVKKIHAKPGRWFSIPRPRIILGVPTQVTEVERRALLDVAFACGARQAYLIEEPMAAAIGANLSVDEPVGSMIVDIGGGTCEIAVISLSGIVVGRSLKVAGDMLDREIISYVRTRYSLAIGEKTAEQLKIALASAYPTQIEKEMIVRGRDLEKGLPKSIRISQTQVREALLSALNSIIEGIKDTINDAPPELASDIIERGITLCGGSSMISGLPKLISQETKMPVFVAEEPLSSVVLGCAKVLEDPELLKRVKISI